MPYSTLLYSTLLYSTLLYSTLHSTLLYSTLLYSTLLYSTLLYSTLLYYTILYYTILYTTFGSSQRSGKRPPSAKPSKTSAGQESRSTRRQLGVRRQLGRGVPKHPTVGGIVWYTVYDTWYMVCRSSRSRAYLEV